MHGYVLCQPPETISNTAKTFAECGLKEALKIKRNVNSNNARRKTDGRMEARIIEIARGPVPEGYSRWTIRLIEGQAKIEFDEPISRETIRRTYRLRPHRSQYWCLPNRADAESVACMEDILDV